MGKPYRECLHCGAHLDAGEICDCRAEREKKAEEQREEMKLIAICREIDKDTGKIAVYPLETEITDRILQRLKIRAQFNPELRYFATTAAHFRGFGDTITSTLKRRNVTKEAVARVGGLVEL